MWTSALYNMPLKGIRCPVGTGISVKKQCTTVKVENPCLQTVPELLENIFNRLEVSDLKSCRLVTTIWNSEACRGLRRESHVCLFESMAERTEDFLQTLQQVSSNESLSPFKLCSLTVESLTNHSMLKVISHHQIFIAAINMRQAPEENNSDFQRTVDCILRKSFRTLALCRVVLRTCVNFGLDPPEPFHLPALRDFGIFEHDANVIWPEGQEASTDFVVSIINGAPNLAKLSSTCTDGNVLDCIFRSCNLCNLEELYAESIDGRHICLLTQKEMTKLAKLNVRSDLDYEELQVPSEVLQAMIANFSASLESLAIPWIPNPTELSFPCCPKLKKIHVDNWGDSLGAFDPHRFPSLKEISLMEHVELEDSILSPNANVETFAMEGNLGDIELEDVQDFNHLMIYCRKQFPNLRHLDLAMSVNDVMICSILRAFPALETLIIETLHSVSSHVFTGRTRPAFGRLPNGENSEEIVLMPSLRDLTKLTKLVLGRFKFRDCSNEFRMTDHMIQYGIAEIPSLKVFQLKWNADMTVSTFVDSLCHLEKIIIIHSCKDEFEESFHLLKSRLPQIELHMVNEI